MELDTNSFDFMAVEFTDEGVLKDSIPNLPSFRNPSGGLSDSKHFTTDSATSNSISLFKHEPREAIAAPQSLARQQQTHEPTCPELGGGCFETESGACPPSTDGFQYIELPDSDDAAHFMDCDPEQFLPVEDLEQLLPEIQAPGVPEVSEASIVQLICILPQQQRQRRNTITLLPDQSPEPTQSSLAQTSCVPDAHSRDIIHMLMDDGDDERDSEHCDHVPVPRVRATTSQLRVHDEWARCIEEMHQAMAVNYDLPHAKKKPMLHEFLGYILFSQGPPLETLRNSVYFCRDNGDRLVPGKVAGARYFRVSNFENISEVWRLIKKNSSQDCTKNMKRAMRMSTTNDRGYFENLPQRSHRQQVFRFGERTVEHFRKVFSQFYA